VPNPENLRPPWKPGQSGNPKGRPPRPDVQALDDLIKQLAADPRIAQTWLDHAIGNPDKGIKPDFAYLKLLIQYRNGNVPQEVNLTHDLDGEARPRIEVPDVDQRPKRRARGRKAKASGSNGDVPS
jgi:hypothetical protein